MKQVIKKTNFEINAKTKYKNRSSEAQGNKERENL